MGLINFGVPKDYVEALRREFGIDCFVETGTFRGETTRWAAERFEKVLSVELSEPLYRSAQAALAPHANVTLLHGDTRQRLAEHATALPPAIVWLDAHFCAGESAGKGDECPLLGEIAALAPAWDRLYVLVDDARYFLAPPPPPHDPAQWPSLTEVLRALECGPGRFVAVFEDVIVSVPAAAKAATLRYIHAGGGLNERVLGYRPPPPHPLKRLRRAVRRLGRRGR